MLNATPATPVSARGNEVVPPSPAFPLRRFLFTRELQELYQRVRQVEEKPLLESLLCEMKVRLKVDPSDMERIPRSGPVVVVANHPFGILDGAALGALLLRVRSDVKILANYLLEIMPELNPFCIYIDPFNRRESKEANSRGLKQAIAHLRAGGMLVVFPAGEVSHWQFRDGQVSDPEWNATAARLIRMTKSKALPVLFVGRNSVKFHLLGAIHPLLRTTQLSHELLNKTGKEVELRIGNTIPAERLANISDDSEAIQYLRWKSYVLADRESTEIPAAPGDMLPISANNMVPKTLFPQTLFPKAMFPKAMFPKAMFPKALFPKTLFPKALFPKTFAPVSMESPRERIVPEVERLSATCTLEENRDFIVFASTSERMPELLAEIGRLREHTFRGAGEGTGKARDLDRFDSYYTHVVLWSKTNQEVAGAYRLVNTEDVLHSRGVSGLYTSTLFNYDPRLFENLGPALELGRSFIRPEYQKQYAPLFILWKGISRYIVLRPQTPILFGAVSISGNYSRISRELLVRYFQDHGQSPYSEFVKPRRTFRPRSLRSWELSAAGNILDLDELGASIAELEEDGKGIPILLKQYLKLGGKLLGFNVDNNFSNVLDGLILVDLRKTDPARLEAFMTKAGLRSFKEYHRHLNTHQDGHQEMIAV